MKKHFIFYSHFFNRSPYDHQLFLLNTKSAIKQGFGGYYQIIL